jgi:hypothetical protein
VKLLGTRSCQGIWILGLILVWGLLGCQPALYQPPLPAPAAKPQVVVPQPEVSRPILYVNANRLNLRAGPGMDFPKISVLERNQEVEKVGEMEDWAQIRVKRDGHLGWVNTRYLSEQPVAAAPETPPAPAVQTPTVTQPLTPPPLPEIPAPAKPPVAEKPKPTKPPEAATPAPKKKPEEARETKPAKPAKPAEAAEAPPSKRAPKEEKAQPVEKQKPATPAEKAAPPAEQPAPSQEQPKKIRIM